MRYGATRGLESSTGRLKGFFQTALLRICWIATQPTFAAHLARTDKKMNWSVFRLHIEYAICRLWFANYT